MEDKNIKKKSNTVKKSTSSNNKKKTNTTKKSAPKKNVNTNNNVKKTNSNIKTNNTNKTKNTSKTKTEVKQENKKANFIIDKKSLLFPIILGLAVLLLTVIAATFAFFSINSSNTGIDTTNTSGSADSLPTPILSTNTASLSMNLTSEVMSDENIGNTYYATPSGDVVNSKDGITVGQGRYILASATTDKMGSALDCTYNFDISATVKKAITDGSDQNVFVKITDSNKNETIYTLKEILDGNVTISGTMYRLDYNNPRDVLIESYVENTNNHQNDLSGNTFRINIVPKKDLEGFSCGSSVIYAMKDQAIVPFMLEHSDAIGLWNSGLEGDGLRFVGYSDAGIASLKSMSNIGINEIATSMNVDPYEIKNLYNHTVNNYICFGTTDKEACASNPDKYMYRIIGIFQEENGDGTINTSSSYHLKLLKMTPAYTFAKWHDVEEAIDWKDSFLYKELNGSYFLSNTKFDYMQNEVWLNKITEWQWISANSNLGISHRVNITVGNSTIYYLYGVPLQVNNGNIAYYNEMNRIKNGAAPCKDLYNKSHEKACGYTTYSYNNSILGLMYVSDVSLSLGSISLNNYPNKDTNTAKYFNYNWYQLDPISYSNKNEWTITNGGYQNFYVTYEIHHNLTSNTRLYISAESRRSQIVMRPVFYLNSNETLKSGSGTIDDPWIINE